MMNLFNQFINKTSLINISYMMLLIIMFTFFYFIMSKISFFSNKINQSNKIQLINYFPLIIMNFMFLMILYFIVIDENNNVVSNMITYMNKNMNYTFIVVDENNNVISNMLIYISNLYYINLIINWFTFINNNYINQLININSMLYIILFFIINKFIKIIKTLFLMMILFIVINENNNVVSNMLTFISESIYNNIPFIIKQFIYTYNFSFIYLLMIINLIFFFLSYIIIINYIKNIYLNNKINFIYIISMIIPTMMTLMILFIVIDENNNVVSNMIFINKYMNYILSFMPEKIFLYETNNLLLIINMSLYFTSFLFSINTKWLTNLLINKIKFINFIHIIYMILILLLMIMYIVVDENNNLISNMWLISNYLY